MWLHNKAPNPTKRAAKINIDIVIAIRNMTYTTSTPFVLLLLIVSNCISKKKMYKDSWTQFEHKGYTVYYPYKSNIIQRM